MQKVQVETQKTQTETDKIRTEIRSVSANVSDRLAAPTEEILFDGPARIDGFDVRGAEGNFWKGSALTSAKGQGELKFEDGGILNILRGNTGGRFALYFQRYIFKNEEHSIFPKDFLEAAPKLAEGIRGFVDPRSEPSRQPQGEERHRREVAEVAEMIG
jgi:hypothetical protein